MRISKKRREMGEEAWIEHQKNRTHIKSKLYFEKNPIKIKLKTILFSELKKDRKLKLIEYKGGKCSICGYDKQVPSAYDFHHLDPNEKDFGISHRLKYVNFDFELLKVEVDKCILVCKNCHAETHHNIQEQINAKRKEEVGPTKIDLKDFKELTYNHCNETFTIFEDCDQKFCSNKCRGEFYRRTEKPSKEELSKLIWEKPTTQIAKDYKISDKTVEKWCKAYGIEKPPRGYWMKQKFKTH